MENIFKPKLIEMVNNMDNFIHKSGRPKQQMSWNVTIKLK